MGILGALFGKSPEGYKSKNVREYENNTRMGIGNRAGATRQADGSYDYSNSFKPITGAEGVAKSTAGYDFSPADDAMKSYRNPTQFNFKSLPSQYGGRAYESRATDIRREGAGDLTKLRESVGPRRPDMIAKLGEDSQRQTNEQLAKLNSDIALREMEKNTDLAVDEQKSNADERFRNSGALADTGFRKIGAQSGLVDSERSYEDKALEWLNNMFNQSAGINNQAAGIDAQNRAASLNFLGSLVGGASNMGKKAATGGMA